MGSITMNCIEWEDFVNGLNNPTQEVVEARRRFFEECDKLITSRSGECVVVECPGLNIEEIFSALNE